jgi:hypothetical protein
MDNLASLTLWWPSLPTLVIGIVGIVLAANRLTQYPNARRFAMLGFGAMILRTVISGWIQMMMMQARQEPGGLVAFAQKMAFINVGNFVLGIATTVFLLLAVFADRGEKR